MKLSPKAQTALDKVVQQFQAGDLSPVITIAGLVRRGDPLPFDCWSFSNRVIAYLQTGSTDLRGFRQWQTAGRQVKKGSLAAFILAPRTIKKEQAGKEDQVVVCGFLPVAVFPYHDTEGDPLPEQDYTPRELPPLADVAARLGIQVTWQPLPSDRLGDCSRTGQQVNVGTHDPGVFFHEIAHAAHALVDDGKLQGSAAHLEAVADLTACVLMDLYGLGDRTGNAWQYIEHFNPDPLVAIQKALAKVGQVLALLLDGEIQ